jgi:hypothetical protein
MLPSLGSWNASAQHSVRDMNLATLQGKLLGLIRSTYQVAPDDDPYIKAVADSEHLRMVQDVVLWWRAFGISRFAVLTTAVLKGQERFDEAVRAFVRGRSVSPFVEELGPDFLEEMAAHTYSLVASIARFELALIRVKKGDPARYDIEWTYDPNRVLEHAVHGRPFDREASRGRFRVVVAREIPDMFRILTLTDSVETRLSDRLR